ncbi:hypothetical protein GXY_12868 [Novacetimonas hansenii ATCC 23769]|uniref:Uncharacterized protein n=1 Tax=Novacetimonas hansenii ATCC 23769 TaxID=714995 RepID=D5QH84_NOVHA|nr:hypothetical protein GXY_12868 [Novacetimonas hansenii ATCC 23769]
MTPSTPIPPHTSRRLRRGGGVGLRFVGDGDDGDWFGVSMFRSVFHRRLRHVDQVAGGLPAHRHGLEEGNFEMTGA